MEIDSCIDKSLKLKSEELRLLSLKSSKSVSKLSHSSRGIPSDKDFHFFYNFDEFRVPVKKIADESQRMLQTVGTSSHVWGKDLPLPDDLDDAYDWLVNVNDELFERFDVSLDEFHKMRSKVVGGSEMLGDGFQLVNGRNKRAHGGIRQKQILPTPFDSAKSPVVTVASRDQKALASKVKVPFHMPAIPRPQDVFKISVDNSNQPFHHVWLQKSEDGMRPIHPLENFCALDFVDRNISNFEPEILLPIETTPFRFVEEVRDLKELAEKLAGVDEFAVDLEHNQYRSFQGLTCLMQISTRTEDYIIDTLKLHVHVGPYLRDFFKDPTKRKVMHGADKDILWLQRDFGIYVCNLFDTGQASKLLKLERKSLAYLLSHFCEINADKEYQNADWRLRPLPEVMLNYARADTHYLLHIYDLMRERLISMSAEHETSPDMLAEVYECSFNVCMRLYEKELLTDSSYLYIYGLLEVDFNAQQLSVVAGLFEWRDIVARSEDESTGYILPNKALLEIAKQMPITPIKLHRLINSRHPYAECHFDSIITVTRNSMQNASAFQSASELLRASRLGKVSEEIAGSVDISRVSGPEKYMNSNGNVGVNHVHSDKGNANMDCYNSDHVSGLNHPLKDSDKPMNEAIISRITCPEKNVNSGCDVKGNTFSSISDLKMDMGSNSSASTEKLSAKVKFANSRVERKVSHAFGSLLGSSVPSKKLQEDQRKLKVVRSSLGLPFCSFSSPVGTDVCPPTAPAPPVSSAPTTTQHSEPCLEEIVELEGEERQGGNGSGSEKAGGNMEEGDEQLMSLSELSSGFRQCFPAGFPAGQRPGGDSGSEAVEPFDYKAASNEVVAENVAERGGGGRTKAAAVAYPMLQAVNLPQGRRRHAFPATGNRSATFR